MVKEKYICDKCGKMCRKSYDTGHYDIGNTIIIKPQYLYKEDIELYLCKECIKNLLENCGNSKPVDSLQRGISKFEFLVGK